MQGYIIRNTVFRMAYQNLNAQSGYQMAPNQGQPQIQMMSNPQGSSQPQMQNQASPQSNFQPATQIQPLSQGMSSISSGGAATGVTPMLRTPNVMLGDSTSKIPVSVQPMISASNQPQLQGNPTGLSPSLSLTSGGINSFGSTLTTTNLTQSGGTMGQSGVSLQPIGGGNTNQPPMTTQIVKFSPEWVKQTLIELSSQGYTQLYTQKACTKITRLDKNLDLSFKDEFLDRMNILSGNTFSEWKPLFEKSQRYMNDFKDDKVQQSSLGPLDVMNVKFVNMHGDDAPTPLKGCIFVVPGDVRAIGYFMFQAIKAHDVTGLNKIVLTIRGTDTSHFIIPKDFGYNVVMISDRGAFRITELGVYSLSGGVDTLIFEPLGRQ